ncbi:hypothetical protein HDV00_008659 [Rhizophlyctis rosea]|nr:hypothetical protein HDV00_008659 [Rhizophlyctis rosea]
MVGPPFGRDLANGDDFRFLQQFQQRPQQRGLGGGAGTGSGGVGGEGTILKPENLIEPTKEIEQCLQQDKYPDLVELFERLKQESTRERVEYKEHPTGFLQQEQFTNMSPHISRQFDSLECKSWIGILPEIHRIWVTIDHRLFLWDYEDPNSAPEVWDDQDQIIVGIKYLLVIATPLEIFLVGVAPEERSRKIQIYQTDFSIAADNVNMFQIEGTEEGRIFMAGHNGQLYELQYQSDEGWFSRKIRKLNHSTSAIAMFTPTFLSWLQSDTVARIAIDKKRNVLYILRTDQQIEAVYLGAQGNEFKRIAKTRDIIKVAQDVMDAGDRLDERGFRIIHIQPLTPLESNELHLLAIAATGHRLYFTCTNAALDHRNDGWGDQSSRLVLVSVRPPPSLPNQGNYNEQFGFYQAYYSDGLFLAAKPLDDERDRIVAAGPNSGAISKVSPKGWAEQASAVDVDGRTHAIARAPQKPYNMYTDANPDILLNEFAHQLEYPPTQYHLVYATGVVHLTTLRPLDILCDELTRLRNMDALKPLMEYWGPAEICAMSLAILSGHPAVPKKEYNQGPTIERNALNVFLQWGGKPSMTQQNSNAGSGEPNIHGIPLSSPEIKFSAKHDGFAAYLARLLRPVWQKNIVQADGKSKSRSDRDRSLAKNKSLEGRELMYVKNNLDALNGVLMNNLRGFTDPPTPEMHDARGGPDAEAWRREQESLDRLHQLLKMCLEGISFVTLLLDYKLQELVKRLPDAKRVEAYSATFQSLVTTEQGQRLAKDLMFALVEKHLDDQNGVESINVRLRQSCPSICHGNDARFYKGMELLRSAVDKGKGYEQNQELDASLGIFIDIAKDISEDNLNKILSLYKSASYYGGVMELGLRWASAIDPNDDAGTYADAGMFAESDPRSEVYNKRRSAYDMIASMIGSVLSQRDRAPEMGQAQDGWDRTLDGVLRSAVEARDALFHEYLYNWLLERGQLKLLFKYQDRDLEAFLRRHRTQPEFGRMLAEYCNYHQRFVDAAGAWYLLSKLENIDLSHRLAYLSEARTQAELARSTGQASRSQQDEETVIEIIDVCDVAEIQFELCEALKTIPEAAARDVMKELDARIWSLTELYRESKAYELYDVMLHIFFTADQGPQVKVRIEEVWGKLLKRARDSETGTNDPWAAQAARIVQLGSRFARDQGDVFPLKYIIQTMEQQAFEAHGGNNPAPANWMLDTMKAVGRVKNARVFECLNEMFDSKSAPWNSTLAVQFLVNDMCTLLERWLGEMRGRRVEELYDFPFRAVDDAVNKFIVFLNGEDMRDLQFRLKKIQDRLRLMA